MWRSTSTNGRSTPSEEAWAPDVGERGLGRLAHDRTQLPGEGQDTSSRHAGSLYEQDFSSERSPGQTGHHSDPVATFPEFPEYARLSQIPGEVVLGYRDRGSFASGDPGGHLSGHPLDATLQIANPGLPGVPGHDGGERRFREAQVLGGDPVVGQGPGDKIAPGDLHLVPGGVAGELDEFHPIAQGIGNGIQRVGGGDEENPGEIVGNVKVVVVKGVILRRIQDLEQSGSGITPKIGPHLVDFIEHEHRVRRLGGGQPLDDSSGHGTDIGAPVSANLCFIVEAAQGETNEGAADGPGNGLSPARSCPLREGRKGRGWGFAGAR